MALSQNVNRAIAQPNKTAIHWVDAEVERSGFFPELDPALLLRYIAMPDQYDAVVEFEQAIRDR
jgi:hypothetical protein